MLNIAPLTPIGTALAKTQGIASGLSILVGLALVFFGRRLFWLFVAAVGFLAGMRLAPPLLPGQPEWVILACGILLGLFGAVLAILLQRVAVAIAGGAAGGALAGRLALALGWADPTMYWAAVIIGALLAALLASFLFDWALIAITSLSGALLVCDGLVLSTPIEWAIGVTLAVAGIVAQAASLATPPAPRA